VVRRAEEEYHADNKSFIGTCPDCGSQLEFAEGCVKCHVVGSASADELKGRFW
jgi:hypothetical protein